MGKKQLTPEQALADLPDVYIEAWREDNIRQNGAREGENIPIWYVTLLCPMCEETSRRKRSYVLAVLKRNHPHTCDKCSQARRWE